MVRNGSRQITFSVTYIPDGTEFRPVFSFNGTVLSIGKNSFERDGVLHIVDRSCEDSDRPNERCKLIQVTVNGVDKLHGSRLAFSVAVGVDFLYSSRDVIIRIVGELCVVQILINKHTVCAPLFSSKT